VRVGSDTSPPAIQAPPLSAGVVLDSRGVVVGYRGSADAGSGRRLHVPQNPVSATEPWQVGRLHGVADVVISRLS
jgi:hypothetical protein